MRSFLYLYRQLLISHDHCTDFMGLKRAVESKTSFKVQKKTTFYYVAIWHTIFIFADITETKVIFLYFGPEKF